MGTRTVKTPNESHSIEVAAAAGEVVITFNGAVIARSRHALELRESGYAAVYYVPIADVDARFLRASTRTSYCPYKGDARYHTLEVDGATSTDAAWSYPQPFAAVASITDHLAFYPERVDAISYQPT